MASAPLKKQGGNFESCGGRLHKIVEALENVAPGGASLGPSRKGCRCGGGSCFLSWSQLIRKGITEMREHGKRGREAPRPFRETEGKGRPQKARSPNIKEKNAVGEKPSTNKIGRARNSLRKEQRYKKRKKASLPSRVYRKTAQASRRGWGGIRTQSRGVRMNMEKTRNEKPCQGKTMEAFSESSDVQRERRS